MPVSRLLARVGAVAFAAGLSLGVPESTAVADTPDTTSHATDTSHPAETSNAAEAETTAAGRPARGPRTATRGALRQRSPSPDTTQPSAEPAGSGHPRRPSDLDDVPVEAGQSTPDAEPIADYGPARAQDAAPQVAAAAASPTALPPEPVASAPPPNLLTATAHAAPAEAPGAPGVPAPPVLATVSLPTGAATTASFAGLLDGLLGPIRALFEGAALMVRRSLFNEAPTVTPIQLTGLTEGPITGTLGAVDPEGDPISYRITTGPSYGSVAVGPDGSYTYTPAAGFTGTDSFLVTATDTGLHINLLDLARPAGTVAQVAVAQSALVTPTVHFQFIYGTGSQYWSREARGALETAAARLGSYVVVSQPVVITYTVTGQNSPFSSTLANSGSEFVDGETGFLATVVQNKIQTGYDANGSAADGSIDWNFSKSWAYGDSVAPAQYDFQSIAMHEMLHTFGFISYTGAPGSNDGRRWTVYDRYLTNSVGKNVFSGDYAWNNAYNPNLTGANGGLYFSGPNAVAANHGLVRLHTPDPWASGSSVSHLGASVSGPAKTLMSAVTTAGPNTRTLSAVELGILRDIGYQVSPSGPESVV